MMAQFEAISYTLRIVYDDLKSRLSELAQNVSAFDHLLLSEHQLADDADFGQVKEYYAQILNMQERIHTEIRHVYTQLKTFHAEKEVDHNQTRKVWIITAACNLKAELAETLERLRKLQTNFVQVHQSKVFDLERALASNGHHQAGDGHARIDLYRNTSNRLETDMQYNVEISGDLDRLILAVAAAEEVNGGNTGGGGNGYDNHNLDRTYDEVAIHSHIQVPRIVTPTDGGGGGVFASARPEGRYTLETIKRKQNLLIIIGVAIGLATIIGIILTLTL